MVEKYNKGLTSTAKLFFTLHTLFGFGNNPLKDDVSGLQEADFKELREYFSKEKCTTLNGIKNLFDFPHQLSDISNNIIDLKNSMDFFNKAEISNEIDRLIHTNNVVQSYNDNLRKELISTYTKFISAVNIFDVKQGAIPLNNLISSCRQTNNAFFLYNMTYYTKDKALVTEIESAYLDVLSLVTFNAFKLMVGDILKLAQMVLICETFSSNPTSDKTSTLLNKYCTFINNLNLRDGNQSNSRNIG